MRVPECINMRKLKMKILEFQTICKTLTIIRAQIENLKLKNYESAKMYEHEKIENENILISNYLQNINRHQSTD